ncbi:MAG: thioesterase family protein [Bacteroidota bacterium]
MISSETKIQVRYDEVDKMGYVYHGNYARYYHISRTDLLREFGLSDKDLEQLQLLLPVIELNIKYLKPVYYDDIITIQTILEGLPVSRMKFRHIVYNSDDEIINKASSTVVFVDSKSRKPMRAPKIIIDKIKLNLSE